MLQPHLRAGCAARAVAAAVSAAMAALVTLTLHEYPRWWVLVLCCVVALVCLLTTLRWRAAILPGTAGALVGLAGLPYSVRFVGVRDDVIGADIGFGLVLMAVFGLAVVAAVAAVAGAAFWIWQSRHFHRTKH